MVVPAFGFSLGDFVAGINIIDKVVKALKESGGAASRYQQAVVELETLQEVLRQVAALEPTTETTDIAEKIRLSSLACHLPIAAFIKRIEKFETTLNHRTTSRKIADMKGKLAANMCKIRWAVIVEGEVAKLKAAIGPQLDAIGLLLQLESLERAEGVERAKAKSEKAAESLLGSMEQVKTSVDRAVATLEDGAEVPLLLTEIESKLDMQERMLCNIMFQLNAPASSSTMTTTFQTTSIPTKSASSLEESSNSVVLPPDAPYLAAWQVHSIVVAIHDGIRQAMSASRSAFLTITMDLYESPYFATIHDRSPRNWSPAAFQLPVRALSFMTGNTLGIYKAGARGRIEEEQVFCL